MKSSTDPAAMAMNIFNPGSRAVHAENRGLRTKLNTLLADARRNEDTLKRFQSLELQLLSCSSLTELIQTTTRHSRAAFGWDSVTISLHDPDHEVRHLLEQLGEKPADYCELIFVHELDGLEAMYGRARNPVLGPYQASKHRDLFLPSSRPLASVALLPLMRNKRLLGSLNLGSHGASRFQRRSATDFLEHLAAVLATCLDTTLAQERLKHAGLTDALTRVNNRRFFDQRLIEEVARSQRLAIPLSCLFIDIDHFKHINDTYGHHAGDNVLYRVAGLIRAHIRSPDVVARYGGEEFAILLEHANHEGAGEIAERIRGSVAQTDFRTSGIGNDNLSVSIGVATLHGSKAAADDRGAELLQQADTAMYQAKQLGRNRVVVTQSTGEQR